MAHDGDEARASKRARLAPSSSDVDIISGLGDDVLLRVLALVPDARDAVRTGALSRRWRGFWARVPALRFASRLAPDAAAPPCADLERYVSFVDGVLARRAQSADCAIEDLSISYVTTDSDEHYYYLKQLTSASVDAVQAWIRYSFHHGLKSFAVDLQFADDCDGVHVELDVEEEEEEDDDDDYYYYGSKNDNGEKGCGKEPEVLLDELPSPVRLEAIRLALGGTSHATLRLPTAMKFASLTDLSLERMKIVGGGAHPLSRLVSSETCPCLRKLHMIRLWLSDPSDQEMRLEANMLSEVWVEDVTALRSLELKTPNLRIFHIDTCYTEELKISAPRLEEVEFFQLGSPPRLLEVDGELPCVRSLKICLWSHRACTSFGYYGETQNDINVLLLKQCISVTSLGVTLKGPEVFKEEVDIMDSRVPHLPQISSLIINVSDWADRHDSGAAGVASLLTRFSNLRRLSLHLHKPAWQLENVGADGLCDPHLQKYNWTSNEIATTHLQAVELTGLRGIRIELSLMKLVLARAKRIHKVAISFNPKCQHPGMMDAFERMILDEGAWTFHREAFMLTCLK